MVPGLELVFGLEKITTHLSIHIHPYRLINRWTDLWGLGIDA
jgi:hypothetical protein